jgi:hypothetical protein
MAAPITDSVISFMLRSTYELSGDEGKNSTAERAEAAEINFQKAQRKKAGSIFYICLANSSAYNAIPCNDNRCANHLSGYPFSYTDLCALRFLCVFIPNPSQNLRLMIPRMKELNHLCRYIFLCQTLRSPRSLRLNSVFCLCQANSVVNHGFPRLRYHSINWGPKKR